ncbi:hypothetical protein ACF0H5_018752 [Mactra antiquata]
MAYLKIIIFGILIELATLSNGGHSADDNWGYKPWNGPKTWPYRIPVSCAGQSQSPISIHQDRTVFSPYLAPFRIHAKDRFTPPIPDRVFNNGRTVGVNVTNDPYISSGGLPVIYKTDHLHFHWGDMDHYGSEHTLNNKRAPLEMHLVTWDSTTYGSVQEAAEHPEGVAVFSILFRLSPFDNPLLEPIVQSLPYVRDPEWHNHVNIPAVPIDQWLPKHPDMYYRYRGSFTTPTCNEGVIWTVFHNKQFVSHRQLNAFRNVLALRQYLRKPVLVRHQSPLSTFYRVVQAYKVVTKSRLVNNFRPLQALNGRIVYRSFL